MGAVTIHTVINIFVVNHRLGPWGVRLTGFFRAAERSTAVDTDVDHLRSVSLGVYGHRMHAAGCAQVLR